MRNPYVRHVGCAIGLLACLAGASGAQGNRGFEIGADAAFQHSENKQPDGITISQNIFSLPLSSLRVAFPTSGAFEPEIAASLTYATAAGRSTSNFAGDLGLLTELSHDPSGPRWFVRPAIGWQRSATTNLRTFSRATIGAGIGVRLAITERVAMRYEARYTHLTEEQGFSGNVLGLLAGMSVFTR
jgi:hypothetical protein